MSHGAKTFGSAVALMFGIQAASAADFAYRKSDCVNNQRVDYNGQVIQDANGYGCPAGHTLIRAPEIRACLAATRRFIWARAHC